MTIIGKIYHDFMEARKRPSLLVQAGFRPGECATIEAICERHDLSVETMIRYAVPHFCDRLESMDEKAPPANFERQAPSFAKPESVFADDRDDFRSYDNDEGDK